MPTPNGSVRLGDKVQDDVSKVRGIVLGITTWLNGCRRLIVQPQVPKRTAEKLPDNFSCDEPTVTILESGVVKGQNTGAPQERFSTKSRVTGGERSTPSHYPTPRR